MGKLYRPPNSDQTRKIFDQNISPPACRSGRVGPIHTARRPSQRRAGGNLLLYDRKQC